MTHDSLPETQPEQTADTAPAGHGPHAAIGRRGFLGGLAVAGAAGAAAALAAAHPGRADAAAVAVAPRSFAFHGRHQQGILTPTQRASAFLSFDTTAADRGELVDLLKTITERARFLTAGGAPEELGLGAPTFDNGVLGPEVPSDGLTVTVSTGASLFDERYGLASAKPARLRRMEDFANDDLDRAICDGDLLLQICADNADTVVHAVRDIAKQTRGGMQLRWRQDGFMSPPRPSGHPRNLMGFKDGTANPPTSDTADMDGVVWVHGGVDGEPAWADGGSYHVVRIIRMLVEFWDRVNLREQEAMIGRRRDTGAPFTGTQETDVPDFSNDPVGETTRLDAHIRLANPRRPGDDKHRMLRRPFNYDNGIDLNGNLDQGLLFVAFNQDLERQFVTVQKRLADEPLVDYISPVGGGYFFALPGVRDSHDWYGSGLLA